MEGPDSFRPVSRTTSRRQARCSAAAKNAFAKRPTIPSLVAPVAFVADNPSPVVPECECVLAPEWVLGVAGAGAEQICAEATGADAIGTAGTAETGMAVIGVAATGTTGTAIGIITMTMISSSLVASDFRGGGVGALTPGGAGAIRTRTCTTAIILTRTILRMGTIMTIAPYQEGDFLPPEPPQLSYLTIRRPPSPAWRALCFTTL
jgi:hypothetical protein